MKKIVLVLTGCLLTACSAYAARRYARITIVADDTALINHAYIEFSLCHNGINSDYARATDLYRFPIKAARMNLTIPLTTYLNYGRIDLVDNRRPTRRPLNHDNNLFLFKNVDNVEMHVSAQPYGIVFRGKDAARYNCLYAINNCKELNHIERYNALMKADSFAAAFAYRRFQLDSICRLQLKLLNRLKDRANRTEYELIRLDCLGSFHEHLATTYEVPFLAEWPRMYGIASTLFMAAYRHPIKLTNRKDLLPLSYFYADFIFKKERAAAVIKNSTKDKSHYPELNFKDIYAEISSDLADGPVKDKVTLIAFYEIDRRRQGDFPGFFSRAISLAGNNRFKAALLKFRDSSNTGVPAYPFSLPDSSGTTRKLSDFKGKIVVMDFWFTGCRGCLLMAKSLKPIVSVFRPDTGIVFMTISIDRRKDLWLKSLSEEKYSSRDEMNLYAGMDWQSPMIKHYNIGSFPTLIVIGKDQKILSVAPPDPRISPESFIAFVRQASENR